MALSFEYLDENIWQWSYKELGYKHVTIANAIDPASWPNQKEPDLEMEDGDLLPDFSKASFLILKYRRNSYVFEGVVPTTWAELDACGIQGISSYAVPEPSVIIMLGLSLFCLVAISKKRFNKV